MKSGHRERPAQPLRHSFRRTPSEDCSLKMMDILLKMKDLLLKVMDILLKIMDFVLKTMEMLPKMMDFIVKHDGCFSLLRLRYRR